VTVTADNFPNQQQQPTVFDSDRPIRICLTRAGRPHKRLQSEASNVEATRSEYLRQCHQFQQRHRDGQSTTGLLTVDSRRWVLPATSVFALGVFAEGVRDPSDTQTRHVPRSINSRSSQHRLHHLRATSDSDRKQHGQTSPKHRYDEL